MLRKLTDASDRSAWRSPLIPRVPRSPFRHCGQPEQLLQWNHPNRL